MTDPWVWWTAHSAAVLAVLGALLQVLPVIAAVVGGIYYAIQIWETRTIQHWWANRQMRKKAARVARLRAQEKLLLAELEAAGVVREAQAKAREKVKEAAIEAAVIVAHDATETEQSLKSTPEK